MKQYTKLNGVFSIMRPFLFLSGEFSVTMPAVFRRDLWSHTMSACKLVFDERGLHRKGVEEDLKGVIYFCRTEDYYLELANLEAIRRSKVPCWPEVETLSAMSDRHVVLDRCCNNGIVCHPVQFARYGDRIEIPFPCVLKVGQDHRGDGKFLLNSREDIPHWEGLASIEPFFKGRSVRVLLIGDSIFGIGFSNPDSWIANSQGAEIEPFSPCPGLIKHAICTKDYFDLDVAGVDYIIDDRSWHFLEINQYPGLNAFDDVAERSRDYLNDRMAGIEAIAYRK